MWQDDCWDAVYVLGTWCPCTRAVKTEDFKVATSSEVTACKCKVHEATVSTTKAIARQGLSTWALASEVCDTSSHEICHELEWSLVGVTPR